MATVAYTGSACTDCIILVANGETPPELSEDETLAWLAAIERRNAGHYVVCGGDDVDPFSSSPCDVCGTHLAGERHEVAFFDK